MAEHEQNPTDIIRYNERLLVCGSNKEGQIALGENTERVDTLSRILEGDFVDEIHDVICGPLHSVFLGSQGVWVCGNNNNSRLGLGPSFTSRSKTRVACKITSPIEFTSRRVIKVCCGENHTLFLMDDHTIWSCGGNQKGQLAIPSLQVAEEPTQIDFPQQIVSIACGLEHTILLTALGKAYSCGSDEYGQLAIGKTDRDPVKTLTLVEDDGEGFSKVECGFYFSAFVTAGPNPRLLTCGRNHYGQLCHGDVINKSSPTLVRYDAEVQLGDISHVVCGQHHIVVLNSKGQIFVGGWNGYGQLGLSDQKDRRVLTHLPFTQYGEISFVNCGAAHTCFVTDREVFMCGYNASGQLGLGHQIHKISTPTPLHTKPIARISCGTVHTVILLQKEECKTKPVFEFTELEKYDWLFDGRVRCGETEMPVCMDLLKFRCPKFIERSTITPTIPPTIQSTLSVAATCVLLKYALYDRLEVGDDKIETCCEILRWGEEGRLESLLLMELYRCLDSNNIISIATKINDICFNMHRQLLRAHVISNLNRYVRNGSFKNLKGSESLSRDLCLEIMSVDGLNASVCTERELDFGTSTFEQDLLGMYNECQTIGGDVTLVLGDRTIRAHRLILSCRCDYFRKKFTTKWSDLNDERVELYSEDDQIHTDTHCEFIKFLYTGTFSNVTPSNAVSLINLWNYYCMPLKDPVCIRAQEVIRDGLNADNVLLFYGYLEPLKGMFKDLEQAVVRVMCENWPTIHEKFSNEEIFNCISHNDYANINRKYLSFFMSKNLKQ